jgi:membrane protease YdiL (CAAX protease family)
MRHLPLSLLLSLYFALPAVSLGAVPEPAPEVEAEHIVSAPLVGWGNLFVPGLGATLRGKPGSGLMEETTEIGLYYGGTFGVKEGNFGIDGSVKVPHSNHLGRPVLGQIMQELGLKYHFYNTFHHYQRAVLVSNQDRQIDHLQPIYKGELSDILKAPFKWENISNPWVYPVIAASAGYLLYSYKTTGVTHFQNFHVPSADENLFGISQAIVIPVGGLMGEETFFRGFMMRETRSFTGSALASLILQSAAFTALHPSDLQASAFASGILFGLMTNHFDGNLEPAITAHFWVNVVSGLVTYWTLQREQGKNTPLAPPIILQSSITF